MDLFSIKALILACETGSFLQASKLLNVTQPTLSNRIDRLESQLKVKLFDRKKGVSRPTATAMEIVSRATPLFNRLDILESDIEALASGSLGTIKLGLAPAAYDSEITDFFLEFKTEYPDVELIVSTGTASNLFSELTDGNLDIVIAQIPIDLYYDGFDLLFERSSPIIAVAKPCHALANRSDLSIEELFSYPGALPHIRENYRNFISRHFKSSYWKTNKSIFCSEYNMVKSLVKSGEYFTVGPAFVFNEELWSGAFCKLDVTFPVSHNIGFFKRTYSNEPTHVQFSDMYAARYESQRS